jgi:hypothetical protein
MKYEPGFYLYRNDLVERWEIIEIDDDGDFFRFGIAGWKPISQATGTIGQRVMVPDYESVV